MGNAWGIVGSVSPSCTFVGKSIPGGSVELLTIAEASARIGLSEKAIRRRIEQGSLASIRRGSRRLIPVAEVERLQVELDFPMAGAGSGNGERSGGEAGNPTTALVEQLGRAVEVVQVETERRVNAERDRDSAVERERSERQAREAAEAEVVELRARIMEMESVSDDPVPATIEAVEQSEPGEGLPASADEAPRRAWWQRMLGGG